MGPGSTKSAVRVSCAAALFVISCARLRPRADAGREASADDGAVADAAAEASGPDAASGVDPPPALEAGADLIELDVPGYLSSFLSVPTGATRARPVLVAAHGVGDRPDWQCNEWRRLLGARAWILCPRGIKSDRWSTRGDTRWTWAGPVFMKREIDAALAARFAPFVDEERMVYAGFSYGAANGVAIAAEGAARFPYVVLTEGGADRWTVPLAHDFVNNGGKRVLFVCGQKSCVSEASTILDMLHRAEVDAKLEYGVGEGHGYGGAVAERIRAEFSWVTVGDPRWAISE